ARRGLRDHPNADIQEENRVARNGDQGQSRDYLSDEDDLMRQGPTVYRTRQAERAAAAEEDRQEPMPVAAHQIAQRHEAERARAERENGPPKERNRSPRSVLSSDQGPTDGLAPVNPADLVPVLPTAR